MKGVGQAHTPRFVLTQAGEICTAAQDVQVSIDIMAVGGLGQRRAAYPIVEGAHRLEAQDVALSRPKQGFESPWGHLREIRYINNLVFSIYIHHYRIMHL